MAYDESHIVHFRFGEKHCKAEHRANARASAHALQRVPFVYLKNEQAVIDQKDFSGFQKSEGPDFVTYTAKLFGGVMTLKPVFFREYELYEYGWKTLQEGGRGKPTIAIPIDRDNPKFKGVGSES